MPQIVPKKKAPGVDFCGVDKYYYIVHSDIGCYMRSTNFQEGKDLELFGLHHSCQGGDHYLAHEDNLFYIIKGNQYRCVSNMNTDTGAVVGTLHPKCCGGDHYLSAFGNFYIIFQGQGIYRQVKNLTTDEDAVEYPLHPDCKNGLYYWGIKGYCYLLKPRDEWGVQYVQCTDFHQNTDAVTYSFHADVVNFLPGGLAVIHGPAFSRWELLKMISNESKSRIEWNKTVSRKVGFDDHALNTLEHNWKLAADITLGTGTITGSLAKLQFGFSAEYGGRHVSTKGVEWSRAVQVEETVSVTLAPSEKLCIWQYIMGLGQKPVMFCQSMKFTSDSTPPTEAPPLPPSQKE